MPPATPSGDAASPTLPQPPEPTPAIDATVAELLEAARALRWALLLGVLVVVGLLLLLLG